MIACRGIAIALVLCVSAVTARAESDLRLWTELGVDKRLPKKFELSFEQDTRFDQNMSRLEAFMPELALWYRAPKNIKLGIGYRLSYRRDNDDTLVFRHVGFFMVRPRVRIGPIELTYRLRYQEEVRESFAEQDRRHTLRNRLGIALHATSPWIPGVSAETFHRIGDGDTIRLRKVRLAVGVEREFGKHELELSYRVEVAQEDPDDPTPHIVGVAYHFAL